jgi:hypothetical protein
MSVIDMAQEIFGHKKRGGRTPEEQAEDADLSVLADAIEKKNGVDADAVRASLRVLHNLDGREIYKFNMEIMLEDFDDAEAFDGVCLLELAAKRLSGYTEGEEFSDAEEEED